MQPKTAKSVNLPQYLDGSLVLKLGVSILYFIVAYSFVNLTCQVVHTSTAWHIKFAKLRQLTKYTGALEFGCTTVVIYFFNFHITAV